MTTRPRYCSYNACKNDTSMKDIHFYRFPKDEQRCKAWVKACKNEKLLSIPVKDLYTNKVLCMNHFEDWCFMNITSKHRLVHNAIPNAKKFLVTRNLVHDNLTNTPVSNNVGALSNTPVSNNVGRKNDTPVSSSVDRQNDTPVSNSVDCQKDTSVSNNVDCQSNMLEQLLTTSGTVSKVYKEAQFENNVQNCKKRPATIPTTFNVPKRPLIPSSEQQEKSYPKPGSLVLKTLKSNNPLAPKSAQIIQITAATSNNDTTVEQASEVVNESLLEQGKSNLSKDKQNDSSKNKVVKEICDSPTTEVMTYLICDVDQELTDFEKMLPIFQDNNAMDFTQNIQIKDASTNRNIMQDISLMSKIAEMESKVKKRYLEEKTDMLQKISNLEREIEGFHKRHKKDQRKIQNLLQLQRQKDRKIATLKKCIADLRQQNISCKNQDNQIYVLFKQPNISKQ